MARRRTTTPSTTELQLPHWIQVVLAVGGSLIVVTMSLGRLDTRVSLLEEKYVQLQLEQKASNDRTEAHLAILEKKIDELHVAASHR